LKIALVHSCNASLISGDRKFVTTTSVNGRQSLGRSPGHTLPLPVVRQETASDVLHVPLMGRPRHHLTVDANRWRYKRSYEPPV